LEESVVYQRERKSFPFLFRQIRGIKLLKIVPSSFYFKKFCFCRGRLRQSKQVGIISVERNVRLSYFRYADHAIELRAPTKNIGYAATHHQPARRCNDNKQGAVNMLNKAVVCGKR
jgi:hypothetical protein